MIQRGARRTTAYDRDVPVGLLAYSALETRRYLGEPPKSGGSAPGWAPGPPRDTDEPIRGRLYALSGVWRVNHWLHHAPLAKGQSDPPAALRGHSSPDDHDARAGARAGTRGR